jgi:hypothetical protein
LPQRRKWISTAAEFAAMQHLRCDANWLNSMQIW